MKRRLYPLGLEVKCDITNLQSERGSDEVCILPRRPDSWVVYSAQARSRVKLAPKQWSQEQQPLRVIAFLPTIPQPEILRKKPLNPSLSWCPIHKFRQEEVSSFCQRNAYWKEPAIILPFCYACWQPTSSPPSPEMEISVMSRTCRQKQSATGVNANLELVDKFCYLGDRLTVDGDGDAAVENRIQIRWKKFRQLVSLLINKDISLTVREKFYCSCVRSSMLHGSEIWPVRKKMKWHFKWAEIRMARWMCGVKVQDRVP